MKQTYLINAKEDEKGIAGQARNDRSFHREKIVVFFALCTLFFSCEDKKTVDYGYDEYYEEIVTAVSENGFLLDNGKTLFDTNKETNPYSSGDRVLLNYTLLHETTSGYDYTVRVNGSSKIHKTELTLTNREKIDSAVNEPVLFESLWLGSHYLNMQCYINYKSEAHTIGLLTDSLQIRNDTVRIYFKHDKKNDLPGYSNRLLLSVDLEKALGSPKKEKVLLLNINSFNYGEKIYELKY
jgi:hypothetical protein